MAEQTAQTTQGREIKSSFTARLRLEDINGEFPRKGDIILDPQRKSRELVTNVSEKNADVGGIIWYQLFTLARVPHSEFSIRESVYNLDMDREGVVCISPAGANSLGSAHSSYRQYDEQLREAGL